MPLTASRPLPCPAGPRTTLLGLALALASSLAACGESRPASAPTAPSPLEGTYQTSSFLQTMTNELDVVFMVDNSASMAPLQVKLASGLASFVDQLKGLPGGLPDLHLGVISSDMGAGPLSVPSCQRPGGDQGAFRGSFLIDGIDSLTGQRTPNFSGDLTDVFSHTVTLGQNGCGFESPFGSVQAALGTDAPAGNAGFLRPNAALLVVLFTNEDDCSMPAGSDLADPDNETYGALQSYRCTELGIVCDQGKPPHLAPDSPVTYTGCHSAEDPRLARVADFVTFLKGLKADPGKVFLTAIAPPATGNLTFQANTLGGVTTPNLAHVCPTVSADSAIRIKQAVDAFGDHGSYQDICGDDWSPALSGIGRLAASAMGPTCLPGPVMRAQDGTPTCRLVDKGPGTANAELASCGATNGVAPCWEIEADDSCAGGEKVVVRRAGDGGPPPGVQTSMACTICRPGATVPGCV